MRQLSKRVLAGAATAALAVGLAPSGTAIADDASDVTSLVPCEYYETGGLAYYRNCETVQQKVFVYVTEGSGFSVCVQPGETEALGSAPPVYFAESLPYIGFCEGDT